MPLIQVKVESEEAGMFGLEEAGKSAGAEEGEPVAFVAFLPAVGYRCYWRVSRIVVLPDYQGIGVGGAVVDVAAGLMRAQAERVGLLTSHPGMIRRLAGSPLWRCEDVLMHGTAADTGSRKTVRRALGRPVARFVYMGEKRFPWTREAS